jgi:hypothetical protein
MRLSLNIIGGETHRYASNACFGGYLAVSSRETESDRSFQKL